jgi:hypothetical protein
VNSKNLKETKMSDENMVISVVAGFILYFVIGIYWTWNRWCSYVQKLDARYGSDWHSYELKVIPDYLSMYRFNYWFYFWPVSLVFTIMFFPFSRSFEMIDKWEKHSL